MLTKDGYATVSWGHRFVLLWNGQQLSDHSTDAEAVEALKKHREQQNKPKTKKPKNKSKSPSKK
jgi:hypothetical protein